MCQQEEQELTCKDVEFVKHTDVPEKIVKRLECGNNRFRRFNGEKPIYPNQSEERRKSTGKEEYKQRPFAIVLSCADSRVTPELIFDTGIADLFVVRVAGNIANTSSIASIEYAVAELECKYILVLGHQHCGAVDAAIKGGDAGSDNLNQLVGHILPEINACKCKSKVDMETVTKENVFHSARELERCSKIIREAKVKIQEAYYNLETGFVDFDIKSDC